jgi:acyl-CoA synthetase (AMP-forming)/AMP-acid ligase II
MPGWNFADLWERIAQRFGDSDALVQGTRRISWAEMDRRANGLASHLLEAGAGQQDKVALYLYNCPEYMEASFAAYKAGLVPVNTNYRYLDDELAYLWDNADAVAVIFHSAFSDRVDAVDTVPARSGRLPTRRPRWKPPAAPRRRGDVPATTS